MKPRRFIQPKDLLDAAQRREVAAILNQSKDPTSTETINLLKTYLSTQKEALLAKGIDPNYLAYAISYQASLLEEARRKAKRN